MAGSSSSNFSRVHQFAGIRLKEDARRGYDRGRFVCTAAHPLGFAPALLGGYVPPLPAVAGCCDRGPGTWPQSEPARARPSNCARSASSDAPVCAASALSARLSCWAFSCRSWSFIVPHFFPPFSASSSPPIYDGSKTCTRRPISTLHLCGRARLCLWGGC